MQLLKIFQKYAETYSLLGMTVDEFRNFLMECQQVSQSAVITKLIRRLSFYEICNYVYNSMCDVWYT